MQQPVVEEPQRCVLRVAKPAAGFDNLVEHRLQAGETGDGAKNAADRPPLLPKGLDLSRQVDDPLVGRDVRHGTANERICDPHGERRLSATVLSVWASIVCIRATAISPRTSGVSATAWFSRRPEPASQSV